MRSLPDTADPPQEPADRPSPVMVQYLEIKTANPDSLLFYRMGNFYELFFEDAEIASRRPSLVPAAKPTPVASAADRTRQTWLAVDRITDCA